MNFRNCCEVIRKACIILLLGGSNRSGNGGRIHGDEKVLPSDYPNIDAEKVKLSS